MEEKAKMLKSGTSLTGGPASFYDLPYSNHTEFFQLYPEYQTDANVLLSDLDKFNNQAQFFKDYAFHQAIIKDYYDRKDNYAF
jgi:hypothetical protein